MHAVVKTYSDGKFVDVLEKRKAEIERLVHSIDGFMSYFLVRSDTGGFSVSIYEDDGCPSEQLALARDWIAKNAGNISGVPPPTFSEGTVVLGVKGTLAP